MLNQNFKMKFRNSIARKFILYILIFSSSITLLLTGLQLYLDYHRDMHLIEERITQVEMSYLQSMQDTLWVSNFELLRTQLEGINQLPDIEYLEISLQNEEIVSVGQKSSKETMQRFFPLSYKYRDKMVDLGTLRIVVSLDNVYQRLFDKAVIILITQSFKTFLVSLFIFVIFYSLVGRHLNTIANYGKSLSLDYHTQPIELKRPEQSDENKDELALLQIAINQMRDNLYLSYNQLKKSNFNLQHEIGEHKIAEQKIVTLNTELEETIKKRTQKLKQTNEELETSLDTLRSTQKELVVQGKMAILGNLVTGVAHELNTPLGTAITATTSLKERNKELISKIENNSLNKKEFTRYLKHSSAATDIITSNLNTASDLVISFKQVSTDQAHEQLQRIDLGNYLQYIFKGLKPEFATAKHSYKIELAHAIEIHTYPEILDKVITSLVMNSLTHGFEGMTDGLITIRASSYDKELHMTYLDNGKGIEENLIPKIFDPFYTTKRGQGGTGLGLHVTYNLITLNLNGSISCTNNPAGSGVKFNISFPIDNTA